MNAVSTPLIPASASTQPETPASPALMAATQTRIMALHLPTLSSDRIMRGRAGRQWRTHNKTVKPLVLAHKHKNAMRLAAMNEAAEALGLRIGQGVADVKAQFPDMDVVPHDPQADKTLLNAVADWCDRYTPLVALNATTGLFLDISGCAHLFGGEHALARDLMARLFEQGFNARIAIAHTPGAAYAISQCSTAEPIHLPRGGERAMLAPFPLGSLRIDSETINDLACVGIKTIGELIDIPRPALARRFGRQCLLRLDQALGEQEEALSPRLPVADMTAERRLASPVSHSNDITQLIEILARKVKSYLEERAAGGRVFEATLFRLDGAVERICVGTSKPLRDPQRIAALFAQRLTALGDDLDAGYGYDLVRLSVLEHLRIKDTQGDFAQPDDISQDIAGLADRIAARLGHTQSGDHPVRMCVNVESHMPHRAEQHIGLNQLSQSTQTDRQPLAERPVRFLKTPEPIEVIAQVPEGPPLQFRWRRTTCRVAHAEGPERIAGEWWGPDDGAGETLTPLTRDYYRVEDGDGRRYWIFRAGLYGQRGDGKNPHWYMQGFFA